VVSSLSEGRGATRELLGAYQGWSTGSASTANPTLQRPSTNPQALIGALVGLFLTQPEIVATTIAELASENVKATIAVIRELIEGHETQTLTKVCPPPLLVQLS